MATGDSKPLGVNDANSVRDRIRQWQSQGGGVVAADNVGPKNDESLWEPAKEEALARKSQQRTPSNKVVNRSITPSRSGRSAIKADDAAKVRTRSGGAPAKRVISDQHWRTRQSPTKSTPGLRASQKTSPLCTRPDDGVRVSLAIEPGSDEERKFAKTSISARTTPRRKRSGGDIEHDSQTRVTRSQPRTCSDRLRKRQSKGLEQVIANKYDVDPPGSSPKSDPQAKESRVTPTTSTRKTSWISKADSHKEQRSRHGDEDAEETQVRCSVSDGKGSQRSHKGKILSKVFTKQASEPIITPRIPSIEQWLHETPDPFVDSEEPLMEEIAPLRPSPHKRKVTPQDAVREHPNETWHSLSTKEGTRRAISRSRPRKRIPSSAIYEDNPFPADFDSGSGLSSPTKGAQTETASKFVDLLEESPEQSPSPGRKGANSSVSTPSRERRKSRQEKQKTMSDDVASTTVSQETGSSVEELTPIAPLQPPGLGNRRPFPSTGGHRLSTIASVETFDTRGRDAALSISTHAETVCLTAVPQNEATEAHDQLGHNPLHRKPSRLTKHADLISVLSLPRGGSKSIQSARSIRTNRSRLANATIGDLMLELATDETKYMRELRTLVDGVIPVLLTCVLSKSDSVVAAGLFRPSSTVIGDANFTKPIIDMGIALERLKTLHKRMPTGANGFLTWAHGAQRVYSEYLKAWRMGFQDVVVNLAPAMDPRKDPSVDEGLPRNAEGDIINGDGERVDVAFLLKRPLVRLKYLAKTLKGIQTIQKSAEAEGLASKYQKLVEDARERSNEERARLEDEAAANIDPTRARDPQTLAPVAGVAVDRTSRVRARDHFNLALQHSSGQRVDCRVELLIRDETSEKVKSGDVLVCEVDGTGRWLLFPPVRLDAVSARNGDMEGEIICLIRGTSSNGSQWQELLSLTSDDENAGFEWVQMLGLTPVPPTISRSQSFLDRHQERKKTAPNSVTPNQDEILDSSNSSGKSRTPSPREVDVPIGERAQDISKTWMDPCKLNDDAILPIRSSRDRSKQQTDPEDQPVTTTDRSSTNYIDKVNDLRSLPSQSRMVESKQGEPARTPRSFKEALGLSGSSNPMGLKRATAKRVSRHGSASPKSRQSPMSSPISSNIDRLESDASPIHRPKEKSDFLNQHSPSSTPSMDLPHIPKARQTSPPTTPAPHLEEEPVWSTSPESQLPASPKKLSKKPPSSPSPKSRTLPTSPSLDITNTPNLEKGLAKSRRSSSPLKHEYEPSTASDTSSDSDASTVEHNEATSVSDDSSDEEPEEAHTHPPLLPLGALRNVTKPFAKPSLYSATNGSIKPSESASQAPYKMVPAQPAKTCKTIASIFTWLDTGRWEQLHPDECSIVITPGLIEAFEMSAAHSYAKGPASTLPVSETEQLSDLASTNTSQNDDVLGDRPLVALELTPLVPLRRGTALDISIRSPPTPHSQIKSGNNIMFRSRNPEECETLYALINHSRIHNPTFIALQNARGPYSSGGLMGGPGSRRPSTQAGSSRSSWFGGWGRSSSYRASSGRTPSISPSESSIGSMSSAFSALKRFSMRNSGMFNIAHSTVGSRIGSRANSVYASSDNSSGSGTNSPIPPSTMVDAPKDAPIGLTDAKIRIYIRETASRWRDMGSARLTIKRAEVNVLDPDGRPMSSGGVSRQLAHEKRIIVNGKTKGEVLLDVQLGESCFERVARTGIAVSVWEDVVGPNGEVGIVNAVGGVSGGRAKVYMIQMKSEAETAYTFSLVGKLRY